MFFALALSHKKKLTMGHNFIRGQHIHWDNIYVNLEWNLCTILI